MEELLFKLIIMTAFINGIGLGITILFLSLFYEINIIFNPRPRRIK